MNKLWLLQLILTALVPVLNLGLVNEVHEVNVCINPAYEKPGTSALNVFRLR